MTKQDSWCASRCPLPLLHLESVPPLASANGLVCAAGSHDVEPALPHRIEIRHTRQPEPDDNDQVA